MLSNIEDIDSLKKITKLIWGKADRDTKNEIKQF